MRRLFVALALSGMAIGVGHAALDINSATRAELEALRGVGPARAQAILDYREKVGPFRRIEDLRKLKGFGKASVDRLRQQISVTPSKPALPVLH